MKTFIADNWQAILEYNNLADFDKLWTLEAQWFEEPNRRRGGWSGVARISLKLPAGGECGLFLKRQEDHVSRTLLHPFRGELTFCREFRNIQRFRAAGIPALEAVYFARQKVGGRRRAVLLTRELAGYYALDSAVFEAERKKTPTAAIRKKLLPAVASVLRRMHRARLQHNCFYPKHIFVKKTGGNFAVRLIDLEKVKWQPRRLSAVLRDLYTLNRHAVQWSRTDRMRFFLLYRQEKKLSNESKRIWRKMAARTRRNA